MTAALIMLVGWRIAPGKADNQLALGKGTDLVSVLPSTQHDRQEPGKQEPGSPAGIRRGADVLVLHYSRMKEHVLGVDAQGKLQFVRYKGRTVTLSCRITEVRLSGNSPSIAIENSVVRFTIEVCPLIPGLSKCRDVELWFDERRNRAFCERRDLGHYFDRRGKLVRLEPISRWDGPEAEDGT